MNRARRTLLSPLVLQLMIVGLGLFALVFAPPARGPMMLIPLHGMTHGDLIDLAAARGARLVQAGPLPHSLVVEGDRAQLLAAMLARGVVVLAGPAAGCTSA